MRLQTLSVLAIAITCVAMTVTAQAEILPDNVVNIDFNGVRGAESLGETFSDLSGFPVGGGSIWNGITVDSRTGDVNVNDDALTISGSNLLNGTGMTTSVNFEVTSVGGDNAGTGADSTSLLALWKDYIFTYGSPFTISGLGSANEVDLYFYLPVNGGISINGESGTGIGTANGWVQHFENVAVTGGTITGQLSGGNVTVLSGMSIVSTALVPEPSMLVLLAASLFGLLCYTGRKRK